MSPIEILENLISRLNNLFTVQTQEVIPELNKIKELLEQKPQEKPVVIVAEKEISNEVVEEVKQEPIETFSTEEYKKWDEIIVTTENNNIVKNQMREDWTTAKRAMEYLKSIKAKGIYNYKSEEKLIARAIKEWFTI